MTAQSVIMGASGHLKRDDKKKNGERKVTNKQLRKFIFWGLLTMGGILGLAHNAKAQEADADTTDNKEPCELVKGVASEICYPLEVKAYDLLPVAYWGIYTKISEKMEAYQRNDQDSMSLPQSAKLSLLMTEEGLDIAQPETDSAMVDLNFAQHMLWKNMINHGVLLLTHDGAVETPKGVQVLPSEAHSALKNQYKFGL